MLKIVQVLENMANDASLINEDNLTTMLSNVEITNKQQQAIISKDTEQLIDSTKNLTKIRFIIPLIPAEDDEAEESEQDDNTDEKAKLAASL